MATLILNAVGSVFGGRIGGAIGAIIGQQIDNRLFGAKGRSGPRRNQLAIQSSSYGSPIAKLFGANRVAGTVIWATDLKEARHKVSTGKGQPKATTYSYSASFAVLLSGRTIRRVGRIWADGNLLRGASGDFKSETQFRLYTGDEGQAVDPLIASVEGVARTPAYRGRAYAVFEDFQLADFGNRIPALSFEVFADDGEVQVGAVIAALAGPGVVAEVPALLTGFAASGDSVRGVADTLAALFPFAVHDDGARLRLSADIPAYRALDEQDLGATHDRRPAPRVMHERGPDSVLPALLSIAHYDPARDYQQGLQRVRDGGGTRRDERIDMPVTLDAARIKGHALALLQRMRTERTTAKVRLPWRYLDLTPGSSLVLPGEPGAWRVASVALDHMVIEADLVRSAAHSAAAPPADSGRALAQPDLPHGPTSFRLLDLPPLDDSVATAPRVAVAAAGPSPGWRSAALLVSFDEGASWSEAGATAAPAVIGTVAAPLGPASALLRDERNSLVVDLLNERMQLQSVSDDGLLSGANAALIGDELVRFRDAQPQGGNRYRLTGLIRGGRGTEQSILSHGAGEAFILLERDTLAFLDVPPGTGSVRVMAVGRGDTDPPVQRISAPGRALMPLSPVHPAWTAVEGDLVISWVRRSRSGWRWLDGVDAPLAEEAERYRVTLTPDAGAARIVETAVPRLTYTADERAADGAGGAASLSVSICQIGNFGSSLSASLTVPLH